MTPLTLTELAREARELAGLADILREAMPDYEGNAEKMLEAKLLKIERILHPPVVKSFNHLPEDNENH